MIITQQYNSLNEIDVEFIPELEDLLADCIPSFQVLKNYEESSCEATTFSYFLFFGDRTNAPIGFAQVELTNISKNKKPLFKKIFRKNELHDEYKKSAQWKIPGCLEEGIVIRPTYVKDAKDKTNKIFSHFQERDDIISQQLRFPKIMQTIIQMDQLQAPIQDSYSIPDTLIKNQSSYEKYLNSLNEDLAYKIKQSWRSVQKEYQFKLGEYDSFKECFTYKKSGAVQYKELKALPALQKYLKSEQPVYYLTLESADELLALVVFSPGRSGNSFYEIIQTCNECPQILLHQLAIIKFYDFEAGHKLHCINPGTDKELLLELGFTKREQVFIKVAK